MADPVRRKTLKKNANGPPKAPNVYCCRCGTAYNKQAGFFTVSHSPLYRGSGYLPFCNNCVDKMFEQYKTELGDERKAAYRMCMKMDLYWNEDAYATVEKTAGAYSRIRRYVSSMNLNRYIDKTFDDTIAEEEIKVRQSAILSADNNAEEMEAVPAPDDTPEEPEPEIEIPESTRAFWGPGYTPEMYLELDERKRYWLAGYPEGYMMDIGEEAIIRQICNLEIDINHDRAAGKDTDKKINTLNTLIGSMNLKPTQKKAVDVDPGLDSMPFGVGIWKWENTRPVPETDPEFKDVNKIVWYITVFFLGHLCSMIHIKNTYCKMYEDEIKKLRVERPEYDDEDDEAVFNAAFAEADGGD